MVHVRIAWDRARVVDLDTEFTKEVLSECVTCSEFKRARIENDFIADIEVLHCVERVIMWRWARYSVSTDQSACNVNIDCTNRS